MASCWAQWLAEREEGMWDSRRFSRSSGSEGPDGLGRLWKEGIMGIWVLRAGASRTITSVFAVLVDC